MGHFLHTAPNILRLQSPFQSMSVTFGGEVSPWVHWFVRESRRKKESQKKDVLLVKKGVLLMGPDNGVHLIFHLLVSPKQKKKREKYKINTPCLSFAMETFITTPYITWTFIGYVFSKHHHQFWHVPKTSACGGLTSASLTSWKARVTELPSTPTKLQMAPPAKEMWETLRGLAGLSRQHKRHLLYYLGLINYAGWDFWERTNFDDAIVCWEGLGELSAFVGTRECYADQELSSIKGRRGAAWAKAPRSALAVKIVKFIEELYCFAVCRGFLEDCGLE